MSIVFDKVSYTYQMGSKTFSALNEVSFSLPEASFTAVIGPTGSGKTTLLKHINALLKPTSGSVRVNRELIENKTSDKDLTALRKQVGFLFQFPETQLFAETVLQDVAFGPENFGLSRSEAKKIAQETLERLHFDMSLINQSPINLSGGQQRLAALAGVLVSHPKILLLDEPTAALDPLAARRILQLFKNMQQQERVTILMVTHDMDQVAEYADQVLVMHEGRLDQQVSPLDFFQARSQSKQAFGDLPRATFFAKHFIAKTHYSADQLPITVKQLQLFLKRALNTLPDRENR